MDDAIPVIDIAALASGDPARRAGVAASIGAACRGTGFFLITGHGVPASVVEGAFAAARAVFALPPAGKRELAISRHGHNRGYVWLGIEALDEKAGADLKEAYNLVWTDDSSRPPNIWPPLPGWREKAQAYFDAVLEVGRRLHIGFALDLDLPEDFFASRLDAPMATLRFLHYPAAFGSDAPPGQAGAGTHTD